MRSQQWYWEDGLGPFCLVLIFSASLVQSDSLPCIMKAVQILKVGEFCIGAFPCPALRPDYIFFRNTSFEQIILKAKWSSSGETLLLQKLS